jgi:hypothetical protein
LSRAVPGGSCWSRTLSTELLLVAVTDTYSRTGGDTSTGKAASRSLRWIRQQGRTRGVMGVALQLKGVGVGAQVRLGSERYRHHDEAVMNALTEYETVLWRARLDAPTPAQLATHAYSAAWLVPFSMAYRPAVTTGIHHSPDGRRPQPWLPSGQRWRSLPIGRPALHREARTSQVGSSVLPRLPDLAEARPTMRHP